MIQTGFHKLVIERSRLRVVVLFSSDPTAALYAQADMYKLCKSTLKKRRDYIGGWSLLVTGSFTARRLRFNLLAFFSREKNWEKKETGHNL